MVEENLSFGLKCSTIALKEFLQSHKEDGLLSVPEQTVLARRNHGEPARGWAHCMMSNSGAQVGCSGNR